MVEPLEARQLLTTLPAGFAEAQIATSSFVSPTAMALVPDGRIFVAEQAGQLLVIKNGQILSTPFLTVQTDTLNERGLVGVELDPNFATNHYVYISYIATTPEDHLRLSRFVANGDVAQAGSETILYETEPLRSSFHNGGAIHFGPDGKIYMSVGENGGAMQAQSLTSHKGKVLRINPDGSIPSDNPFVAQTTGNFGAIWAMGFRNPFSFALQSTTGRLFANDVGTATWEEVDDVVPGANYGYPDVEGPTNDPRFHGPLFTYQHTDGCAVVGAAFYTPASATFPADYVGDYFFGDLCKRNIRTIDTTTNQMTPFASALPGRPVDIDVAADGSLYYLARPNPDGIGQPGGVFRISFTNSGAPSIAVQPQDQVAAAGQPVTFAVSAAGAPPLSYQWQRNGAAISGATGSSYTLASVSAADQGAQFRVVVSNGSGSVTSNAATLTLATGQAPVPTITSPAEGSLYAGGDTITFSGAATDPEDGVLRASAFTWRIDLYHDEQGNPHTHPAMQSLSGVRSGSYGVPPNNHTESEVWLRLTLTVRDSSGLETTVFRDINPRKVNLSLASNVPGLRLNLEGAPTRTPATVVSVVGIERTLTAPPTEMLNGVTYEFVSWSDGEAGTHIVSTPAADTTYTATYRALDDGSQNPPDSPDLTATLLGKVPASALTGARGRTRIRLANEGPTDVVGEVTVGLFVSPDPWLDEDDPLVLDLPKTVRLRSGASKNVPVRFTFPQVVDGSYFLLAWADRSRALPERNEGNNVAVSAAPTALAPAFVDLSATLPAVTLSPPPRRRGLATLLVRNDGNVPATGALSVALVASTDQVLDAGDVSLDTFGGRIRIKPGGTRRMRLRFAPAAGLVSGQYFVIATLDPNNGIAERNDGNNTAVSSGTFTVG
jgi:glucose/arabinose dehydrogenase